MTINELTAEDSGTTVQARVGDVLAVLLAENATTGYRWHVDLIDSGIELVSDGYRAAPPDTPGEQRVGSGGTREFRVVPTRVGLATMSFKHWREWEGDSSVIERVSFVVDAVE